ncbi:MAG: DUF6116 family protein [bacterium]
MNKKKIVLAVVFLVLFIVDVFVPDPLPFVDEILFGVLALILGGQGLRKDK